MASEDPSFMDSTLDLLMQTFQHDKFQRKQVKIRIEANEKTNIYQSNSINLMLQTNRYSTQAYHLMGSLMRLESGKNELIIIFALCPQ